MYNEMDIGLTIIIAIIAIILTWRSVNKKGPIHGAGYGRK
jgi:hypothetical protein